MTAVINTNTQNDCIDKTACTEAENLVQID